MGALAGRKQGTGRGRRLIGWLAVLPFLLLSLIVPGTMLERDARGGVTVVLCAGDDLVEMVMAADGSLSPAGKAPHGDHRPCDWAPHGQPLLGADIAAAPAPLLQALHLARVLDLPDPLYRAEMLAPSARGPPRLA
ncbi:DUF2946 family protein [Paracoccus sp. TOH]|uniref:DUF2946 family protein n=1 Tax=Paracoccus sp. TOH TaxID=1263728 RepID=UPI0025B0CC50|nr:DUF2946 family protein [Paracoccus sp. TOH]WJS83816.1 hypothetical protein NBE95_08545 [Paracoccus sp. TOH]